MPLPGFTRITSVDLTRTLARRLVPVADRLRDLLTKFGMRPYAVRIIRTRWTGGIRGVGAEIVLRETPIEPTPLVMDLSTLTAVVQPVGLDEIGAIQVSQISGRYTEDQLRGREPDGQTPTGEEQVWWEIEFPTPGGGHGQRRRFHLRSAPHFQSDRFEWQVRLEKAHQDRDRNGDVG